MIKIYPVVVTSPGSHLPLPENISVSNEVFWQGTHICGKVTTAEKETIFFDLSVCEVS